MQLLDVFMTLLHILVTGYLAYLVKMLHRDETARRNPDLAQLPEDFAEFASEVGENIANLHSRLVALEDGKVQNDGETVSLLTLAKRQGIMADSDTLAEE